MRLARAPLVGEPNNLCDFLAAGIAEEYLRRDPDSRIRCAVSGGRGALFVTGEYVSGADFDISLLVRRLLGTCGVYDDFEIFVSLEPAVGESVGRLRQPCESPLLINGYATKETPDYWPWPVHLSKKIASLLDDKRRHDPDWFWLGASGNVSAISKNNRDLEVIISVDHGTQPLDEVRESLGRVVADLNVDCDRTVKINPLGARDNTGLGFNMGKSGGIYSPYGCSLPSVTYSGTDWHRAEVYGFWLARFLAVQILKQGSSQAVMTELLFMPGDVLPISIGVRDERGHDLSKNIVDGDEFYLSKIKQWQSPNSLLDSIKARSGLGAVLSWES